MRSKDVDSTAGVRISSKFFFHYFGEMIQQPVSLVWSTMQNNKHLRQAEFIKKTIMEREQIFD